MAPASIEEQPANPSATAAVTSAAAAGTSVSRTVQAVHYHLGGTVRVDFLAPTGATCATARGLVANLSDVLFKTGSFELLPGARERLARVIIDFLGCHVIPRSAAAQNVPISASHRAELSEH